MNQPIQVLALGLLGGACCLPVAVAAVIVLTLVRKSWDSIGAGYGE